MTSTSIRNTAICEREGWRTCETCHSYRAAEATGPCPVCGSGDCQRCGDAPGYGFRGREWLCVDCLDPPALNRHGTGIVYAWATGATLVLVLAIGGLKL